MRNMIGTNASACGNVNDVAAGGRKTGESIEAHGGTEGAVLVDVGRDDAVAFSDEVDIESVPSLDSESDDEESEEEEEEEEWEEESEEEWESDEEEEDEEDAELDEGLAERRRILADARELKTLAVAFARPELGVASAAADGASFGRNYFNRPSAPEMEEDEFADERAEILEEAAALKKLATDHMHPEVGVITTDASVFGRNYFDRPSASEVEDMEDAEERARVLAEAAALKKLAVDHMHPEAGVTSTDGACFGRNYFARPSAHETEEDDFADERAEILEEAAALKKLAADYMHPEAGVTSADGACFGRDYFTRPSAPGVEDDEDAEECARVFAEAATLKKLAVDYMHPEVGVTSASGECFGRNYFNRPSAVETEEDDFADERIEIVEEAAALKKLATGYMHPEVGVITDATAFGRNYFDRPSAPEAEDVEDAQERARVLAEAAALKKLATDYVHPEVGVAATDATVFGRNYFNRPSALLVEDEEDADERARVLAEAAALKKLAVDHMHPEVGVTSADGACFGRNYFARPSAHETEEDEFADERAEILEEAAALKKLATDYMHPEVGVVTDATAFGRNYFDRPSASEVEDVEDADERARVLAEAAALKKLATDYMHPEVGTIATDTTVFGRNYFNRPSAPGVEDDEDAEERARVLAEAAALKKLAVDHMHPEVGVTSADGACFGRDYFARPSAHETEEDDFADERAEILEEAAVLKKLAADYMHPEVGVVATDATLFGCNYFSGPSSTEVDDEDDAEEPARVLAEAAALKKLAMDYMHPEVGVTSADGACFGRNYFARPSAHETEEDDFADERAEILEEAAALKKLAADYMHPEVGVVTTDATLFGRNYFSAPSAPEVEDAEERARVLAEAAALKKLAVDHMHPEVGVTSADGVCFGRNYFARPSAHETEEDELADERAEILEEASALKKLAADYMHPEVGVSAADATVFGRNYFSAPSAPEVDDEDDAEECARVLADAAALKKSVADYMHPEVGITATDATVFGRNYFHRPSAPGVEDLEDAQERARVLVEAAALKKLAVDYMHPEAGVTSTDGVCFGRDYFARPSAPETEDDELAEECAHVLAEAAALKKLATDYMHPEVGVTATDATAFGRNYFGRYSAPDVEVPKKQVESLGASQDMAAVQSLAAAVKGANLPSTKSAKLSSSDHDADATKKSASTVNLFGLSEAF